VNGKPSYSKKTQIAEATWDGNPRSMKKNWSGSIT
jgi:hypothetical protein